jgi:DNA repair protein RecN (Recombination protein N)
MLSDLHVRNLAVLEEVGLELGPGLNVLTGETGAGKSIVVDALALLAGARASGDLLRAGSDQLSVVARFDLPAGGSWAESLAAAGLALGEGELVARREIGRDARSRAYLDDQPVTLRLLAGAVGPLLALHAQREELEVAMPGEQRALLDASGGRAAEPLLAATRAAHERYAALAERLARADGDARTRRERIDTLRFQVAEIDAVAPIEGEEEALRAERELLRHAEAVGSALAGAWEALADEGSAGERLAAARRRLEEIAAWLPEGRAWGGELEELGIRTGELARAVRDRLAAVDAEPGRLDTVEERLGRLERLLRKHGVGTRDLLELRGRMAAELAQLEGDVEHRDELAAAVEQGMGEYRQAAERLSTARRAWAAALAARVHRELADLGLARARFAARLDVRRREGSPLAVAGVPVEFGAEGYDRVVFELAANPGEEARPLARSASGGELSRIYLALRLAVRADGPGSATTMVFDEADAGLGGEAAQALGRKLARLARGGQILAVTHLPQVASHADHHFLVVKRVHRGRTRTTVERLDGDGRVREIARMLSGEDPSPAALAHAREMLREAAAVAVG